MLSGYRANEDVAPNAPKTVIRLIGHRTTYLRDLSLLLTGW